MDIDGLQDSAKLPIWDDEKTRNAYALPLHSDAPQHPSLWQNISPDQLFTVGPFTCLSSPQSHIGPFKWAIDLLVPDGTPVLAAQDGVVAEVREDSDRWGNGPEFRDYLNYVTIGHPSGEYTQYCHLAKSSVAASGIRIGSVVRKGQQIAVAGKTGWTDRDHLHFVVFREDYVPENPFGFKSLQPRFE